MFGLGFQVFCGSCDSEVDFGSLGDHFCRRGVPFGVHFGCRGLPLELRGRHRGSFWGSWSRPGVSSGGSVASPGRIRRASASKDPWSLLPAPHFKRFERPKGGQKGSKLK